MLFRLSSVSTVVTTGLLSLHPQIRQLLELQEMPIVSEIQTSRCAVQLYHDLTMLHRLSHASVKSCL